MGFQIKDKLILNAMMIVHDMLCFNFRMRGVSRLLVLPLTADADPIFDSRLDELMDKAGGVIGQLVILGDEVKRTEGRVEVLCQQFRDELPHGHAGGRIAKNYAMLVAFTELVRLHLILE